MRQNFHKVVATAIATVAVVIAALGVGQFSARRQSLTPEDRWANAILHSFAPGDDAPRRTLVRFAEAIAASDSPSNIYVSLGDYLRGPVPVAGAWQEAFGSDEKLFAAAADHDALDAGIDSVFEVMNGGDESTAAYLGALRADPGNRLAHFRVSVYGDDETGLASSQWLTKNDTANALGLYLEAAYAIDQHPGSVLKLMKTAVSRPSIYLPPDVFPVSANTTFPSFFERFSGKPVSSTALEYIVHRQNTWFDFNDSLRNGVEMALDHVFKIADDCGDARSEDAIVIHQQACHQLIFNQSGNLLLSFSGIFRHDDSYRLLTERIQPSSPMFAVCERQHRQVQRFRMLLKSHWQPRHEQIREVSPDMIFSGTANPVQAETNVVMEVQSMALEP